MAGRRFPLALVSVVLALVISGCSSGPYKPAPDNPSGTLLDVGIAAGMAKDYAYRIYSGSGIVVPFNVTRKLWGGPAAWDGFEAGNCSRWSMYLEGIVYNVGSYRYVHIAVEVSIKGGEVSTRNANVEIKQIPEGEVNATAIAIWDLTIEDYLVFSSHSIFLTGQVARPAAPAGHYLQSVGMTLYHNTTSPVPGTAVWEVGWKYIDNDSGDAAFSKVEMDGSNGKVLKVIGPK